MEYPILIERDLEAGGYVVSCPTLRGCVSQGETEEEALAHYRRVRDEIRAFVKTLPEALDAMK